LTNNLIVWTDIFNCTAVEYEITLVDIYKKIHKTTFIMTLNTFNDGVFPKLMGSSIAFLQFMTSPLASELQLFNKWKDCEFAHIIRTPAGGDVTFEFTFIENGHEINIHLPNSLFKIGTPDSDGYYTIVFEQHKIYQMIMKKVRNIMEAQEMATMTQKVKNAPKQMSCQTREFSYD